MENCIFCKIVKGEIPSTKIYEDEDILAFLDIHPVNIGHSLIIPKKHFENIFDTPKDIMEQMITAAKKVSIALKALNIDGINVTMNNNKAAGQLVFHCHIHVIPRLEGDGFKLWHGKRDYNEGEKEEVAKKITQAL